MPTRAELETWQKKTIPEYMNKLQEAYDEVYNDWYRAHNSGIFKRYLKKFDRMIHALGEAVNWVQMLRDYEHGDDANIKPLTFFHECFHYIENCKYIDDPGKCSGAMIILEKYLMQVHRFLNTKTFDRFSVYSGSGDDRLWWDYVYSEEDGCYIIADEYIEDFDKVYNLMYSYKNSPDSFDPKRWHNYLTMNYASIIRRLKAQRKKKR